LIVDTTLVTVTVLSMGMAAALSVIVWRMLRVERQRTDARVASLTMLAAAKSQTVARPALDIPIRQAPEIAASAPMFGEREHASPWMARVGVMAGLALAGAAVVFFTLASAARGAPTRVKAPGGPGAASQQVATVPAGLELLSLRDSRQAGSLTITGLVQNPRNGSPLSRVTVTAYAFDDKGAFLASGRALIDVTALSPGDESPFVVTVPVAETVARYRIGFRTEDGRVIAHVDRRQSGPIAALRLGSGQANW
jgi:hypothetical protein